MTAGRWPDGGAARAEGSWMKQRMRFPFTFIEAETASAKPRQDPPTSLVMNEHSGIWMLDFPQS